MICSLDDDNNYFNIITGVLQRDTSVTYMSIICWDYILRTSIELIKENGFIQKRQEADYILQKLWQSQITQTMLHFSQIHLLKPNPYCIAWSKQQEASTSTWMPIKQSSYVLNMK